MTPGPRQFIKLCLGAARRPGATFQAFAASRNGSAPGTDLQADIRRTADWLLRSQEMAPDGAGYSRRFSLLSGWDRAYVETTGYILPTLLDVSQRYGIANYRDSAYRAAEWLLSVQTKEGSFTDIDRYSPHVFDTGQVLLGLNRMVRETGEPRFRAAQQAASEWLVQVQEADGSWVRHAFGHSPHSYYSRVGAALIEAGQLAGDERFVAAGLRNLEWTAAQRQPNGYFAHCAFRPGEDALLHTIVYVLEGFIMAHSLAGEPRWLDVAVEGARTLSRLETPEGLLHSQYAPDWHATNREYCVTGLAQYAGLCFDVANLLGEPGFKARGQRVLDRLRGWQVRGGREIEGALSGSIPIWGYYGGMEFLNWNAKFFLDAALKCAEKRMPL